MTIRQTMGLGAFILSTVTTGLVQAQTFPDKPITMIVSYAAGATTDISARTLAAGAEKILGVPITVENKGGGGGTVSTGLLASKKPDGYTVLVGSTAAITSRPMIMKVSYDPKNVVGMLQYSYFHNGSIVVNSNSPWKQSMSSSRMPSPSQVCLMRWREQGASRWVHSKWVWRHS